MTPVFLSKELSLMRSKFAPLSLTALALAVGCSGDGTTAPDAVSVAPLFDRVPNKLDNSVDAMAETMPLTVGGTAGTTVLYVVPENDDGKNGCNLTGSKELVVSVASSNPAIATVSPSSLTFGSCGDEKTVTITPVSVGTTTIALTQASNTTDGSFSLVEASFTVNVSASAPANTAPAIAVAGVTGGASYVKGSVPAATCTVTDAEDGNSSFAATLSAITGDYASDGIGSQTASCSYTDAGGLTASASKTYSIVDPSPPTIGYTLNPASPDGSNDWYKSNVALTWTVTESESPSSLQKTGCVNQTVTTDQSTTYSCSATSAGGSSGDPVEVTIKRDATAPVISSSDVINTTWRNTDLSQSFTASDATSGLANTADASFTLTASNESADASTPTTVSKTVTDVAGNSSTRMVSALIDKTSPTVSLVGGPADGSNHYFGSVPATPACSASDALSGLASCHVSGYSTAVGTHTVTATARDNAGNTNTATTTYTVLAWSLTGFYSPVDMNGVVNTVKGGATVPLKFEVFAGATELTSTSAIASFRTAMVACTNLSSVSDEIEITSTGGTSLRYDATSGQFIQNWQTPKLPGMCYKVTMTTLDGSSIVAQFKLK